MLNTDYLHNNDNRIEKFLIGEKCGTVTISIYEEMNSKIPIFHIQSDNENVLPVSYVIEDALALY